MKITLSLIVPVYNVELYLRKCVDSLLAQDYSDYEIILVDDGSTDDSWQIVQDYVSRFRGLEDERIRGIHQQNAGLSAARNTGIAAARGEYLMFVDSDDYIKPNVLGGLMAKVEQDDLDVLRYRLQYVRIEEASPKPSPEGNGVASQYIVFNPYKSDPFKGNDYSEIPTDGVTFLNERMNTQCYAWQFILRRDLIYTLHNTHYTSEINTLFTEGIYFEDTDWTPRMLVRAKRVASTETVVYNYLMREGSITNAVNRSKQKKVLDDKMGLVGELQRQSAELALQGLDNQWFARMIADNIISIIEIIAIDFYTERKVYLAQLKQYGVFPIHSKVLKARLMNISPSIAIELLHLKNGI